MRYVTLTSTSPFPTGHMESALHLFTKATLMVALVFQNPPVIPCEVQCLESLFWPSKAGVLRSKHILIRYLED